jgi:hypothetical protein
MSLRVVHRLATKCRTTLCRALTARRHWATIAMAEVESMIDVAVEVLLAVKPRSRADEYTAREPLRTIVAVWSASIGRRLVISVRAIWWYSDPDAHRYVFWTTTAHENGGG